MAEATKKTKKKEESAVEEVASKATDAEVTSEPSYVNYRDGYTIWDKFQVSQKEKETLPWNRGIEPSIRNYWYDMSFDMVYTSMFSGKPYEIQFVKEFNTLDCKMIFPDRIEDPYEFGMLTLGFHKRLDKQKSRFGDEKDQSPAKKEARHLKIKPGPTYYQLSDLDPEKLQGLQTPVGNWIISQTICDHFFFKIVISCEYTKLPRIQCLLNQEPIIQRGAKKLQYRKIAQFL